MKNFDAKKSVEKNVFSHHLSRILSVGLWSYACFHRGLFGQDSFNFLGKLFHVSVKVLFRIFWICVSKGVYFLDGHIVISKTYHQ